jgi:hypothetical protein
MLIRTVFLATIEFSALYHEGIHPLHQYIDPVKGKRGSKESARWQGSKSALWGVG